MAVQSYSQEIWDRLKEVYESSPKITWQKLVDQVAGEMGCDMPSPSVVRRKAITEKWKKCTKNLVKKTARELNNEIKKLTSKKTSQENTQSADSKGENDSQNNVKKPSNIADFWGQKSKSDKGFTTADLNRLTSAKIMQLNRRRLADLGQLAGDTITSVIHIRDEVLQLDINNLDEDNAESQKIVNGLKFKMGLISQIVDLNIKQSITLSNIAKSEALFWGFELEELKDQSEVQAKRSATISDAEERMRIAKEKMATDKKAAFARKLALIEAGDPEQDDEQQVEA
ncbi:MULTISPECIES: hypothetical protein [unclassified Acinetobacter]|uniref:hypothetical protein n=1 Tax=unclassified Acinetobacter TaxID=196816 RepID=UPI00244CBC3E|nr:MULTISPECIES: hypothetical protein [unclassified Acinetobacter]MDH0032551.1 hypothetical protein [Acinetobacter sp. GD04021]MDH0885242.1 hypothetical protein [Acinetobacter sp. GD03873]MDH1084430.1 hypothetical protein [Acinetobacter sp. GD03983]MDH2188318.1 hypothetical protein [Acinetobacter sp. GD03645]MDH2203829.1 hypothetical protein [Acinetobacter sp. GD03647]